VSALNARPRAFEEHAQNVGTQPINSVHRGLTLFEKSFTVREGLGPHFNAISCASCHDAPVVGGSGGRPDTLVKWMYGAESDMLGVPEQRFALTPTGAHHPNPIKHEGAPEATATVRSGPVGGDPG
jgi:hypothetical protein